MLSNRDFIKTIPCDSFMTDRVLAGSHYSLLTGFVLIKKGNQSMNQSHVF